MERPNNRRPSFPMALGQPNDGQWRNERNLVSHGLARWRCNLWLELGKNHWRRRSSLIPKLGHDRIHRWLRQRAGGHI